MADRNPAQWDAAAPRTPEQWDALLDAKRERIARSERVLADLTQEACPGHHFLRGHRDSRPPWCDHCGRGQRGIRVMDDFDPPPVEQEPLQVLVVSFATGVVHRWDCDQAPTGADQVGWSPRMAGMDDEACSVCLPGGLIRS